MKHIALIISIISISSVSFASPSSEQSINQELESLQKKTQMLQSEINKLQKALRNKSQESRYEAKKNTKHQKQTNSSQRPKNRYAFHSSPVTVHSLDTHPESIGFYPTALIADEHVVTYIAGTPVVSSPYLGERPAFDGSDYIVNISSINRDIRLMQQRRRLYQAYQKIGYSVPYRPIIALSGAVVPFATVGQTYFRNVTSDITLAQSEVDVAAALNDMVEGYMSLAFDDAPAVASVQRISNSAIFLNMGFVNIGNLDKSPFYFTAGQLFVPFGRYSSTMISAPLPRVLSRTRTRPVIFGYKSQRDSGPFAAVYGFKGDTTLGESGVGGFNLGYVFSSKDMRGEFGGSLISSINNASGMQNTGSIPGSTFGGFSSVTNGNEAVKPIPAVDVHGNINIDRYNFTAEWVGTTTQFRTQDLSFDGRGARPSAGQLEAAVTFMAFEKPASAAIGYQWSRNALALNMPAQRVSAAFNISLWKDTVESIEYRHDIDYKRTQFANGASPVNATNLNTVGTGKSSDTLLAQIGVYF